MSANQINVAVPLVPVGGESGAVMQVTVNGVLSPPLQFPVTYANPAVFTVPGSYRNDSGVNGYFAVARNADGSVNSSVNPAKLGSVISVFVNGLATNPQFAFEPRDLYTRGGWSITNSMQTNPFVLEVSLQTPSSSEGFACQLNVCAESFQIYDLSSYLGGPQLPNSTGGLKFGAIVYLTQAQ